MADTWLPAVPACSSLRTEIGTITRSDSSGSSPLSDQVLAQGAADDGEDDVVDRGAGHGRLDPLDLGEVEAAGLDRPGGRDTLPLKRVRGASVAGASSSPRRTRSLHRPRRRERCAPSPGRSGRAGVALLTVARLSSVHGDGVRLAAPLAVRRWRSASGRVSWTALVISSTVTPSTAAWWIFCTMAKLPGGTPSTLSRPSMTVASHSGRLRSSGARVQPGDLDAQLAPVARLRQGDVADVELEVEVGVLDPVRMVEAERHLDEPLAEDPRHVQPLAVVVEDALERDRAARRRRRVVDVDAEDVARRDFGVSKYRNDASIPLSCCTRTPLW